LFLFYSGPATRGHPFKLANPDSRINVGYAQFFSCSGNSLALWNRLPEYVVYGLKVNNV